MSAAPQGLTRVSLPDLERLERLLEGGRLPAPLSPAALQAAGLGNLWSALEPYAAQEPAFLRLLLQTAAAERTQRPVPRLELVWTGPDPLASRARDTGVVVRELFQEAQESVLVAGFRFDHGAEILRPLHQAMAERGVEATVFVDLSVYGERDLPGERGEAAVSAFLHETWPFGAPWPTVYYDPRTANRYTPVSLHAKCVVTDERLTLVTSANFTQRGQERNVELGARIEDPAFARLVLEHWRGLMNGAGFRRSARG